MKRSDEKVNNAIKSTEFYLKNKASYPSVNEQGNFTAIGCERRNLEVYKEMLGQDKRKLTDWERQLYQAL